LIERNSHPDFRLIQPTDRDGAVDRLNGVLRVEQAAEIIHDAALRPVEARYKVFILQDFQQAHDAFANKLLKTLEEPPDHVLLCLTATDRSAILPTIVSRCQIYELRPLSPTLIANALTSHWKVEQAQAALLSRLANGRLGWAVEQLQQQGEQNERLKQLQTLWQLIAANRIERLAFAEQLAANRNNEQLFGLLELWMTWWHDLLLVQTNCAELCANIDQQDELIRQAQALELGETHRYLQVLRRIEGYLHHTVNVRLALDVLLLQMPYLRATPR